MQQAFGHICSGLEIRCIVVISLGLYGQLSSFRATLKTILGAKLWLHFGKLAALLLATVFLRQLLVRDIFLQLTMPKCFPALIAASIQLTAVLIFLNVDAIPGVGNQIGRSHKWEEWGVWSVYINGFFRSNGIWRLNRWMGRTTKVYVIVLEFPNKPFHNQLGFQEQARWYLCSFCSVFIISNSLGSLFTTPSASLLPILG